MYKHRVVQGLADLIGKYGGKSSFTPLGFLWSSIKREVPSILRTLDENEEAVAEIERKIKEVLDGK